MSKIIAEFELGPEDFICDGIFSGTPSAFIALSDYTGGDYDNVYIDIRNDVRLGGPWWKRAINWFGCNVATYHYIDLGLKGYDYFNVMTFDVEFKLDGRFDAVSDFTVHVTVEGLRDVSNARVLSVTTFLEVHGWGNDDY